MKLLHVTVTRGGQRVSGLEKDDFDVLENRSRQELAAFGSGDPPLSVVLLLDCSLSIGEDLEQVTKIADSFLERMKTSDEAALIAFSDRALRVTPFTNEGSVILKALRQSTLDEGGTAINDHLYAALRLLDGREGRRVVVLVSDGIDVVSMLKMKDVLWKVRRSQALIYWIQLPAVSGGGKSHVSAWRDVYGHRREIADLELSVKLSGGRIVPTYQIDRLGAAFEDVLGELREQYTLGYIPSFQASPGEWRQIKVKVGIRGAKVRARSGYVDD